MHSSALLLGLSTWWCNPTVADGNVGPLSPPVHRCASRAVSPRGTEDRLRSVRAHSFPSELHRKVDRVSSTRKLLEPYLSLLSSHPSPQLPQDYEIRRLQHCPICSIVIWLRSTHRQRQRESISSSSIIRLIIIHKLLGSGNVGQQHNWRQLRIVRSIGEHNCTFRRAGMPGRQKALGWD